MSSGEEPLAIAQRALVALRRAGADAADALCVESETAEVRVRGPGIDYVQQAHARGLGLRALLKGPTGMRSALTSTSDLSLAAVERMAQETVALARVTAPDPHAGLPEEDFAHDWPDLALCDERDRDVPVEVLLADARRAEEAARASDPRIVNSEGSGASSRFSRIGYADSRGFAGGYASASHAISSEPLAREGESLQRDYWLSRARSRAALADPAEVGARAAQRACRRLGARPVATCRVPVIFDNVTAPSLLGHIAACVGGYSLYRGTSFLRERMGEIVASESVSVRDDGGRPAGLGSRPFDGEGQAIRAKALVERGRLASWLLDSYSARKLGLATTGNAMRGVGGAPSVGAHNLWLEPGALSLEDLIASTPRGLLVTELIGMGFQPSTGDYSRGAAGIWIENGELAHPVEEVTIAGNLDAMLRGIDAVACDLVWLGSVAAPSLRITEMTLAGRA